jgi:hypothetical protein
MRKEIMSSGVFGRVRFVSWFAFAAFAAGCGVDAPVAESSEAKVMSARAEPLVAGYRRCGTRVPSSAELAQAEALDAKSDTDFARALGVSAARGAGGAGVQGFAAPGPRVIPVYFHVVTHSSGEGDVTPLIANQMAVLNQAYKGAGFKFKLIEAQVIQNDDWYLAPAATEIELEMKMALRRGGANALNVYTGLNDGTLLGWATPPSQYRELPEYDGVVVLNLTMPGGGIEIPAEDEPDGIINYSGGDTLTHEVGHWLGLEHTFEGGCSLKNDRVLDTPAEAEPQVVCVRRDSCTGRWFPGTDPIHNFMDYVDDDCMNHFTPGQVHRMRRQHAFFRAR